MKAILHAAACGICILGALFCAYVLASRVFSTPAAYPRFVPVTQVAPEVCEHHGAIRSVTTYDNVKLTVLCADGNYMEVHR